MRSSGDRDIQIYDVNFIGAIKMCTICEYVMNLIRICVVFDGMQRFA